MSAKEILTKARALIEERRHWTRGAFARNDNDDPCEISDPCATSFCVMGALARVGLEGWSGPAYDLFVKATQEVTGDRSILLLNDFGTHEQVVHTFDVAIEMAED